MAEKLVIRNIGLLLSGALENPVLDADTVVAEDGRIAAFGREADCNTAGAVTMIDAKGVALAPGLIDSHVHPVFGDWTPRQSQLNWIDSTMHGGVTTMISAGEVHLPGRPRDPKGVVALGITAQRAFSSFPPGGVKVRAGAPILETGMEEDDFRFLAEAGVKLLGEIGLGGVKTGEEAKKMVGWARKYGIQSTIHTGGPSIPGSGLIDADIVLETGPDIIGHINGGHTSLPQDQIACLCEQCQAGIEIVHNGNEASALFALRTARELDQLHRVILGTDGPAGSGVQPLGILRMVAHAVGARRRAGGDRVLLRDRKHRADARARLRVDRGGPGRRFRPARPRPAQRRQGPARLRGQGRHPRGRHGGHRRQGRVGPQPQHPPRRPPAGGGVGVGVERPSIRGFAATQDEGISWAAQTLPSS